MSNTETRRVAVSTLNIDPAIQRQLDRRRVERIANDLNVDAIGVITVSQREGGSLFVVDGMHRVEALKLAGGEGESVDARVFTGLTIAEEAGLFIRLNTMKTPQAFDLFKARIVEEEPVAVAIRDMLAEHGWRLSSNGKKGDFVAVAAIERVYRLDPEIASQVISVITRLWGSDPDGVDGRIVEGFGALFNRYRAALNADELVTRVSREIGNPGKLLGLGRDYRAIHGKTLTRSIASVLLDRYNKNRKTKALPPWDV